MQSVSITSTSLKPLSAHKTVINYHDTGEVGTALIEWSHIKQKAKHHPKNAQVKMHLPPHQLLAAHTAGMGRVSRSGLASPHSTEKPEALSHLFNAKGWSSQSMGHVMPTSHQHHCKQKNWGQPNMPSLHPAEVVECLSMPVYHTQREFWQPHLPNISKHKIPQANSAVCPLSSEGGGCRKGP